ncbi:MAG TPA: HAMP domain-containing sensor histidine kinase [Bryobacteraceae bacterium]|nr:HAMP domain-containing sensor histidine kinase [Bryobacteraceae bacterium]
MSLRTKLIVIFLAATLAPMAVMVWVTIHLFETSLSQATTVELDEISLSLRATGLEMYQTAREILKEDALAGRVPPQKWKLEEEGDWPAAVTTFASSGEQEWFGTSGANGEALQYLVRQKDGDIWLYERRLGVGMDRLKDQFTRARELVDRSQTYDLRKGLTLTLLTTAAAVYLVALAILFWIAFRVSRPMRALRKGLQTLASGDLSVRLDGGGADEAGQAIASFNETAAQLEASRDELVHMTRIASWQTLARKMAHEVKNSLTPIRLTMEEIGARNGTVDADFLRQASQIVADEVTTLEKRVRAFSDFAAEPPAYLRPTDLNALVEERVAFLRPLHPGVHYKLQLAERAAATADPDLLRGVLTNLLENAAQAVGGEGQILTRTFVQGARTGIAVADSGPGVSELARSTLFEPSISFKKNGMGLGLSIARRSVLLCGGDIEHRESELGGAAFVVMLPAAGVETGNAKSLDR